MVGLINDIIKIALAIALGLLIGYEREKSHKPAGLRTHILVSVGSTLITIVSLNYFPDDPARITSAVITGMGFLGAGTIIAAGKNVIGLTTAASLWVMSIIGISVGVGEFTLATLTSVIVLIILFIGRIERKEETAKVKTENQKKKYSHPQK